MPSPFPGMDPYLEQPDFWLGYHGQALTAIVAQLVPQVNPAYVVQMQERLLIDELPVERQRYIEIRDRRSRSLVTVIELLSPSNKRSGPDREQYLTDFLQ